MYNTLEKKAFGLGNIHKNDMTKTSTIGGDSDVTEIYIYDLCSKIQMLETTFIDCLLK